MVVVMIENVYPVSNKEERIAGRSRRLPRNIRACGQSGGALPVYMEDYVGTYIRRLTESGFPECAAVVLVGQVMETEIGRCLFVRGAINASEICRGDRPVFGEDVWNAVYEKIRLYFPDDEVVGWCVAGPGFRLLQEDVFLRAHIDNFADSEKIFCCYESLEKELVLRVCEGGSFRILPGYYIYYEKNDEMQDYMMEEVAFFHKTKEKEQENEAVKDGKVTRIEELQKKKEEKNSSVRKDMMQLIAIAGIIVLIVSVMVGTDTLSKLKESVFTNGEDVSGTQLSSDDVPEDEETENPEEFAFGDFDFLEEAGMDEQEEQMTAQAGADEQEEQMTAQAGADGQEEQTDAQVGTDEQEEQTIAQAEEDRQEEQTDQQAATQTGQENMMPAEQQKDESAGAEQEEENPDYIEEETVTVLSPTEYTRYIVQSGDTLAKVCREVYGSVELLYYVCELNQLKDVDSIYVGQELILPKK